MHDVLYLASQLFPSVIATGGTHEGAIDKSLELAEKMVARFAERTSQRRASPTIPPPPDDTPAIPSMRPMTETGPIEGAQPPIPQT